MKMYHIEIEPQIGDKAVIKRDTVADNPAQIAELVRTMCEEHAGTVSMMINVVDARTLHIYLLQVPDYIARISFTGDGN
jgi:hypothetical protein